MAFSFGNSPGSSAFGGSTVGTNNAQTQTGPDLEEIQTEALGFLSIAGDAKVRLLPSPWPSDALPPPTSSLMSTASNKGLVAAAGPDVVIIASTDAVRQAFTASESASSNVKSFSPQLTIPIGMRISQVAFSSDENFLVLSAENGGGLAVYNVSSIMQGNTQTAFEISTNGVSLRALIPNPTPEKAELFAAITVKGDLLMANLKTRQFLAGQNGQAMKSGVSCASWSTRGKQLVAGLGDGTGFQMTPEGEGKAEIPRPPDLGGDQHVSSISWLENNVFLMVHTPTAFDPTSIPNPSFHLVTRQPPSSFMFQKLQDPCPPFGLNRSPPFHFMQRLKDYPPNIQDILVVASTASTDIGVFSRSKSPLTSDAPAEKVTGVFTTTGMANDSRRAQLSISLTEDMTDTSPIGVALDLSSKEKVKRPLVGEEMDESPIPLPALMVLNNEGILASWWIVYSESVRQGTAYPGLAAVGAGQQQQPMQQNPAFSTGQLQQTAFGKPAFGTTTSSPSTFAGTLGKSSTPAFGATSAPLGMGNSQSPWATSASASISAAQTGGGAFAKPTFGSSTAIGATTQGPAFGATGGLGNRPSPWGGATSSPVASTGNAFGQPGSLGMRTASTFGSNGAGILGANATGQVTTPVSGGFGTYANSGGFGAVASQGTGDSVFGKGSVTGSFGSGMDTDTSFGGTPKKQDQPAGLFGNASTGGFNLGSTFKGDGTAKDDVPKPSNTAGGSFFGTGFGNALEDSPKTPSAPEAKEADMDGSDHGNSEAQPAPSPQSPVQSTTPAATPIQAKSQFPGTAPPVIGGLFGTQAQSETTPASVQNSEPAAVDPTKKSINGVNDQSTPPNKALPSQRIKPDPEDEEANTPSGVDKRIPEAPLPPDPSSKTSYAAGDSSASSRAASKENHDDAPLPPDFVPQSDVPRPTTEGNEEVHSALLSGDEEESLDEEGSGEDVAQDLSPTTDTNHSPRITPGSSFGGAFDRSPVGGLFTKIPRQDQKQDSRSLFGEVGNKPAPFFPPPSNVQQSPRSPSPMRKPIPGGSLRSDNARSVSTPGLPMKSATDRKVTRDILSDRVQPDEIERKRLAALRAKRLAEEEQDLSDREDEKVREELETEVEATTTLAPFLAHQDYVGNINKPGIPGQIEKVYRDINSMVDTLGLNARSLQAFIKGHEEMYKEGGRERNDLDADDWVLSEIDDLSVVEDGLEKQLNASRVQDVSSILSTCKDLQKELNRARLKHTNLKRLIAARSDPDRLEAVRSVPLTAEQAAIQHDLRKDFAHLQKLLVDAEQCLTMLKAKLASHPSTSGARAGKQTVPTVEAVLKTITTMTSMAEKKSGDIDVLETQIRRLGLAFNPHLTRSSSSVNGGASRDASPFATPSTSFSNSKSGRPWPRTPASGASTLFYTPGSSTHAAHQFRMSLGPSETPSRRKLSAVRVGEEDVLRYREKAQRRKEVCRSLREALGRVGGRVRGVDDP